MIISYNNLLIFCLKTLKMAFKKLFLSSWNLKNHQKGLANLEKSLKMASKNCDNPVYAYWLLENFKKYQGYFSVFYNQRGWVDQKIIIFEKYPYSHIVPFEKHLTHPNVIVFLRHNMRCEWGSAKRCWASKI